ncbi:testis-expressed protein 26 isoform X2 [Sceloporus undulatus]|uniref:testis-expressed protein 26 isoform X2 n=1 Tax=Sceloporus undulatus TaxID=8520 RepID=UPI001C4B527F|nr:testis-expressed protein 26 isoform X2 [Sceloporus undulatus]
MEPTEWEQGPLLPPINGATAAVPAPASAAPKGLPWRPRSARVASPSPSPIAGKINWDPYESTMKHDFLFKPATDPDADCARAGRGHVIPFQVDEPTGRNVYQDEYCWKPYSKAEAIRAGTASGIRRNNPQTGERFLMWQRKHKEETPLPTESFSPWTKSITKHDIEEALKNQYKTSYARDYLGIQPGAPREDFTAAPDWKMLVPRPPDTEFRRHFQPQIHDPDLKDFTWKYGCNAKRKVPVKGAVPSVSSAQIWNHEHTKQLSTYQRDFGRDYLEMVSVLNSLDPEEIKAYVDRSPYPEKAILQNFLDKADKTFPRLSSSKKTEENLAPDNFQEKIRPPPGQLNHS